MEVLDKFIEYGLEHSLDSKSMVALLLNSDTMVENEAGELINLWETIRRKKRKINNVNVTILKTGRVDPSRSRKAKLRNLQHKATYKRAQRKYQRSYKRRQVRQVMHMRHMATKPPKSYKKK